MGAFVVVITTFLLTWWAHPLAPFVLLVVAFQITEWHSR